MTYPSTLSEVEIRESQVAALALSADPPRPAKDPRAATMVQPNIGGTYGRFR